jgi:hypothetical protein
MQVIDLKYYIDIPEPTSITGYIRNFFESFYEADQCRKLHEQDGCTLVIRRSDFT